VFSRVLKKRASDSTIINRFACHPLPRLLPARDILFVCRLRRGEATSFWKRGSFRSGSKHWIESEQRRSERGRSQCAIVRYRGSFCKR